MPVSRSRGPGCNRRRVAMLPANARMTPWTSPGSTSPISTSSRRLPARRCSPSCGARRPVWWHEPTAHTPDGEGLLVGAHARRVHGRDPRSGHVLVGDRRRPPVRRHDDPRPAGRRDDAQHDGRPAPSARAPAREQGPDAAHDRAARSRSSGAGPRGSSTTRSRAGTCDFVDRGRGRAADAGDLHPAWASPRPIATSSSSGSSTASTSRTTARRSRPPTTSRTRPRAMFEYGTRLIAEKRAHPGRRHALGRVQRDAARRGSAAAHRPGAAVLLQPAVGRGRRHDAQRDRGRDRRAHGVSRPARGAPRRPGRDADRRSRRSCAGRIPPRTTGAPRRARSSSAATRSRAGDKVVFWEASANRDELVFAEPFRFDVRRQPNPHLGFGHGVHHCLGASLARLEIRVVMTELLARVGTIELDRAGRVDAQQQAHRDPAAAGAADARGDRRDGSAAGTGRVREGRSSRTPPCACRCRRPAARRTRRSPTFPRGPTTSGPCRGTRG